MNTIHLFINHVKEKKSLNTIFKSRFRSQDRLGQIYFLPNLYSQLLPAFEKSLGINNSAMNEWLEICLKNTYFQLLNGEIVPLSNISEVHLISPQGPINSMQLSKLSGEMFKPAEFKGKVTLTSVTTGATTIPNPSTLLSVSKIYEVYIVRCCGNNNRPERVWLGDDINLVLGVDDLTLDHNQPVSQVLEANRNNLPYIMVIDQLIRSMYYNYNKSKITSIISQINLSDQRAYSGLIDEMMFVLRESHGIKICSPIANYNNK